MNRDLDDLRKALDKALIHMKNVLIIESSSSPPPPPPLPSYTPP